MNLLLAKNAVREIRRIASYPPQHQTGVHIDLALELLNWVVFPCEGNGGNINPIETELMLCHAIRIEEARLQRTRVASEAPALDYFYSLPLPVLVRFEALIRADCAKQAARAAGAA